MGCTSKAHVNICVSPMAICPIAPPKVCLGIESDKGMRDLLHAEPHPGNIKSRSSTITSSTVNSLIFTSTTSVLSVNLDTPRHVCANAERKLLDQLTEIHDQRQMAQRREWDMFVKQRVKSPKSHPTINASTSTTSSAGGAAAILGLGTACEDNELLHSEGLIGFAQLSLSSNRDEQKVFGCLVRSGIPLVYRSKVWLECSGGLEMKEPGLFTDRCHDPRP